MGEEISRKVGRPKNIPKLCKVDFCGDYARSLGYCGKHHKQFWKHGRIVERFELVQNKIEKCGNIAKLFFNNSPKFSLFDFYLIEEVSKQIWYLDKQSGYALSNGKIRKLHHLVLPLKEGFITDHRNRNRLDNRRKNLRHATKSQSNMNSILQCNNSSGIKGLSYIITQKIWQAKIGLNRKRFVKRSTNQAVCEAWLKKMRPILHGEYACEG